MNNNSNFNSEEYKEKYDEIRYEKLKKKYDNIIKEKTLKKSFKDQLRSIRVDTFTKALVGFIIISAVIDLQLSYVLAFLDKVQIAESLSTQICITIIGVALVYMIRAYFDTKADRKDSRIKNDIENDTIQKIQDVIYNSGIDDALKTKIIELINSNDDNEQPPIG